MKLLSKSSQSITLEFSIEEIKLVCNALNEVCNGIDIEEPEFETRLGGPRERLLRILADIKEGRGGRPLGH
jgi:hypothetical protein